MSQQQSHHLHHPAHPQHGDEAGTTNMELNDYYGLRGGKTPKEVSFFEYVEVTDSSVSPDTSTTNSVRHQNPNVSSLHYEPLRPPAGVFMSQHPPMSQAMGAPTSTTLIHSNSSSPLVSVDLTPSPSAILPLGPPTVPLTPYNPYGHMLVDSYNDSASQQAQTCFLMSSPLPTDCYNVNPLLNHMSSDLETLSVDHFTYSLPMNNFLSPSMIGPASDLTSGASTVATILDNTICKSSSSDSDTNDSATRLISESVQSDDVNSLQAPSHPHMYMLSTSGDPGSRRISSSSHTPTPPLPPLPSPSPLVVTVSASDSVPTSSSDKIPPSAGDASNAANDALWMQLQGEQFSAEMRQKFLNSTNSTSASETKDEKRKRKERSRAEKSKAFHFRRIGCGDFGFVCPLRRSIVRFFTATTIVAAIILLLILAFGGCHKSSKSLFWCLPHSFRSGAITESDQNELWWRGTTFYEIFPASFQDSDGDGYGDFEGIRQRVSYLRSLGISAVRLSPIFAALDYPRLYENVLDFRTVDPHLGNMNDFRRLVSTLSANHIRVILELNPTVTSAQHPWANQWTLNRTGKYQHYYESRSSQHSTLWRTHSKSDSVSTDAPPSPETLFEPLRLNWSHPAVVDEMLSVAKFWLDHVDGLHLHGLSQIYVEGSSYSSAMQMKNSRNHILHNFLSRLRAHVNELNGDVVESSSSSTSGSMKSSSAGSAPVEKSRSTNRRSRKVIISSSNLVTPYLGGLAKRRRTIKSAGSGPDPEPLDFDDSDLEILDPALNAHVMHSGNNNAQNSQQNRSRSSLNSTAWRAKQRPQSTKLYAYFDLVHIELNLSLREIHTVRYQINSIFLNRPAQFPPILWSVGGVQRQRLANRFAHSAKHVLAAHYLLTIMPGTVSIFYGDEIAMPDATEDLDGLNSLPLGQLSPMPWTSLEPNGNFSSSNLTSSHLWMPLHVNFSVINVKRCSSWIKAVSDLNHFRFDHLYSDWTGATGGLADSSEQIGERNPLNYLFHYIDENLIVLEQYFDRKSPPGSDTPSTRYRYVLFANFGDDSNTKDFSDKFHFSTTQLATNTNRTSEFLIMKSLRLSSGEALIVNVQ